MKPKRKGRDGGREGGRKKERKERKSESSFNISSWASAPGATSMGAGSGTPPLLQRAKGTVPETLKETNATSKSVSG